MPAQQLAGPSREGPEDEYLKYLTVSVFLEELQCLLDEVNTCVATSSDNLFIESRLRDNGFKHHQLYESIQKHLQVAQAMQRLRLPSSLDSTDALATGMDGVSVGSLGFLLGVTPQDLLEAHLPNLDKSRRLHSLVIPEMEQRLASLCRLLGSLCSFTGEPGPALVQHVSAQAAAARQGEKAILRGWQEQVQGLDQYFFSMTSLLDGLISLIKDVKLGSQKVADDAERERLLVHSAALLEKLRVLEGTSLQATYTAESIPALTAVSQHLEEAERKTDLASQQAAAALLRYEWLGPEFEALAKNYKEICANLDHAEFTLAEFQRVAGPLDEAP